MRFANPTFAHILWLLPVLLLALGFAATKRKKDLQSLAEPSCLTRLLDTWPDLRFWVSGIMTLLVITCLVLALMGPQWDFTWQRVQTRDVDIVFVVDVSNSMLARDIKPGRLERAKLAIRELLPELAGDRVGLVAFAGTSFLQVPLTTDYSAFDLALRHLQPGIMPQGGTAIEHAINEAIDAFSPAGEHYKIIILISDGENHTGDPVDAARKAARTGITVHVIGTGTTSGDLIPITVDGRQDYLRDKDGNIVKTALAEETLINIARAGNGTYTRAGAAYFGLQRLYNERILPLNAAGSEKRVQRIWYNRYQIPLFAAIALIVLESFWITWKGDKQCRVRPG